MRQSTEAALGPVDILVNNAGIARRQPLATEMVLANPAARTHLIPAGRFGEVEEVAQVAVMLALNGYITGQTINVNGGWYMS